jgi:hypothetical protein
MRFQGVLWRRLFPAPAAQVNSTLARWASGSQIHRESSTSMTKRKKLPPVIQTKVLVASGRRCCLCFGLNGDSSIKRGQIAHLNHNPNNDSLDNLAYLCLLHHDQYDSKTSQSKSLTIQEVKLYRDNLYQKIAKMAAKANTQGETATREETGSLYLLPRIHSGKELVSVAGNALIYKFDNDEPETEEEMELIRTFFDNVVDFCEDIGRSGAGEAVSTAFWFNSIIEELEQKGFRVFGQREGHTAIVTVIRAENPTIVDVNEVLKTLETIESSDQELEILN